MLCPPYKGYRLVNIRIGGAKMGIRNKLLGIIALLIIVPLLVVGGSSYLRASDLLTDNLIESNISLTKCFSDVHRNK